VKRLYFTHIKFREKFENSSWIEFLNGLG